MSDLSRPGEAGGSGDLADAPRHRRRPKQGRFRAREFRRSLTAHLRAGGDLETLARQTRIDRDDLGALLRGRLHWVSPAAAQALEDRILVPAVVEYPTLSAATIPVEVVLPYLNEVVERHGATNAAGVVGLDPRRVLGLRQQDAVTPKIADRVVSAAAGPMALYDDPVLRRFWFASLPGDTLHVRAHKRDHQRTRARREARSLVAA